MKTESGSWHGAVLAGFCLFAQAWASVASASDAGTAVGPRLYVGASFSGPSVVDLTTNQVIATLPVGASSGVYRKCLVLSPDGRRLFASGSGGVAIIDTATNQVTDTVPVSGQLILSPDGQRLYVVSNAWDNSYSSHGLLSVVDTQSNQVVASAKLAGQAGLWYTVISPNGRWLYVANGQDGMVSVFDTTANQVVSTVQQVGRPPLPLPAPPPVGAPVPPPGTSPGPPPPPLPAEPKPGVTALALSPGGQRLYVAYHDQTVAVVDTIHNQLVDTLDLYPFGHPFGWVEDLGDAGLSPGGKRLYVADFAGVSLAVIDTATDRVLTVLDIRDGELLSASGASLLVSPDGGRIYVLPRLDRRPLAVIDAGRNQVIAHIQVEPFPWDQVLSPNGDRLYVSCWRVDYPENAPNGAVSVIDTSANRIVATVAVEKDPTCMAIKP